MSEKVFRVLLEELSTICIRCKIGSCSGVIEMSTANLSNITEKISCPVCKAAFTFGGTDSTALEDIGKVIENLKAKSKRDNFQIEFVIPDSG